MPKLSIITINYNNAEGLKKTIDSVVNQSSPDFEYIVIDGGSTDGSDEIIRTYQDKLAYWISEPDRGIYHAMNKGIRQANGEFCQFLNSGDYLVSPDVTEQMLRGLPNCSIAYGNEVRQINGKRLVERGYSGRQITLMDMYRSTISHSSAYIKRSLFEQYGLYDESLKIVSDWKFYLITVGIHNEKVIYRDVDVAFFDLTGISNSNKELDKKERIEVLNTTLSHSILPNYQEFNLDGIIIRRLKRNRLAWFMILNTYRLLFRLDKLRA
ncbi:glycosyltransferase [Spirosoma sp. BT702]|uniref:Glycosyltransferase n=1 Tax=Spirosoma profusum TaxID=2771354 RepID=A0A926XUK1_9BACT|nr:glycosyltransferase family 2 protein [Spirosoma profusum]MBD2700688.1 glycosyltransferase [Spirosoma profusum]